MKIYVCAYDGDEPGCMVHYDRLNRNVRPLRHICLHSPDGFLWGYNGSAPADLALSIVADALGERVPSCLRSDGSFDHTMIKRIERSRAWRLHQAFKRDVVSQHVRKNGWMITDDAVRQWAHDQEET